MPEKKGLEIVVEYEKNYFNQQLGRKERLDSKATSLISLAGVIISVYIVVSSYILEKLTLFPYFYVSSAFFVAGNACYLYAAYKGLKALKIRRFSVGPDPRDFADKWSDTKEEDTLIALMVSLVGISEQISDINVKKVQDLESGFRYLILGLLLTFLFVFSLIFAEIINVNVF